MRGALCDTGWDKIVGRIIPAYAGSTKQWWSNSPMSKDHPRVCGEHDTLRGFQDVNVGSSPRMRGALFSTFLNTVTDRIIPAYAGSTYPRFLECCRRWDHPRVCGEHISWSSLMNSAMGSSPRMRGALNLRLKLMDVFGIIPAYAGSTSNHAYLIGSKRDHPRVCGEHADGGREQPSHAGSSPRMRVAPPIRAAFFMPKRIIPAYAGSTRS